MFVLSHRSWVALVVLLLGVGCLLNGSLLRAVACPFCNAVSQTLRQEMGAMDAVVIATAVEGDSTRDKDSGEVMMKVQRVLRGDEHVSVDQEVKAIYYGDVSVGRRFMLSGVDPPALQWSCLPVSARAETYIAKITEVAQQPIDRRLMFYHDYLQDEESMLSRDAYDEFAIAPYEAVKKLKPHMDHDQLIEWISDPELATDRKRLFLTLLGICGDEKDLPLLEQMLRSTQKSTRGGLDALVACYLTLAGEKGLALIDELFLANQQAPYADTYAAIMAIRFHGTEGDILPRSALVGSLHHVLDRKDLADLVIPDLARWSDWTQIDRLVDLFVNADADNNWVRVPVVNYMRACPLPEAAEALKKLEQVDPESVRRANTFFSIPVPAKETGSSSSSVTRDTGLRFAVSAGPSAMSAVPSAPTGKIGQPTADISRLTRASALASSDPANPWRLAYVLGLALATVMIAQFLLLSGGSQPSAAQ